MQIILLSFIFDTLNANFEISEPESMITYPKFCVHLCKFIIRNKIQNRRMQIRRQFCWSFWDLIFQGTLLCL